MFVYSNVSMELTVFKRVLLCTIVAGYRVYGGTTARIWAGEGSSAVKM
jgi:hypothetical protein